MTTTDSILFNGWKHHAGFIKNQLEILINEGNLDELIRQLKVIGGSVTDFYFGKLGIDQINQEVLEFLNEHNINERAAFSRWILRRQGHHNIQISDQSCWTLRFISQGNQYVHIHPARHSDKTIRFKGTTLKTVIILYYFIKIEQIDPFRIEEINKIRSDYLSISPIKVVHRTTGLGKMIDFFIHVMEKDKPIPLS